MTKDKIKAGFSLDAETIERLEKIVKVTRLSKSAVVDTAIELFAKSTLDNGTKPSDG
jgi:predicted transcriptional regulator